MKREDLCPQLRRKYYDEFFGGVEKVDQPGFENLWFVVPPVPPRKVPRGLPAKALASAMRVLSRLPNAQQADDLDRLISFLFLRREAVQSSRMEGTWSTIDHVLTPGDIYDENEAKSERASVLGYAHALETEFSATFQSGYRVFNRDLACRLHAEVLGKDPAFRGIPGQIRNSPIFIGGLRRREESIFNPAPPRHVERCLRQVMAWYADQDLIELGDAGMGMPLPARMAIGHAHFEAVHPFIDGNGRVGRMLMTLQMAAHGVLPLYLSGYIEAQKRAYVKALQAAQKMLKYGPIVEFICDAIVASYAEMVETREAIGNLPGIWRDRSAFRAGSAASRLLDLLSTHPIFTVGQIQDWLKVTRPAANHAAAQLVTAKIARERTGKARNRVFAVEEVVELLARKFSEPPSAALLRARQLLEVP